jgi:UDP-N-acetylglucosamine/UDP-N-acetyl-alpha-D-glucosaminouronate 4-epimerase
MRVLVTGGAGFIGSNLVDRLVNGGAEVVVLDDLSTGYATNLDVRVEFIEGDICDPVTAAKAVTDCDVVFHQAAARAVSLSVEDPMRANHANVTGTLSMLVAARDAEVRRFVYASSSSVYGGANTLPTPESATMAPRSPYAVSKLAGEHYCRVFWELFGLETIALRYFNVFGPRQRPDTMYAGVIPRFVHALDSSAAPEIHGDGLQSRDFTYVDDAVGANLLAAQAPAAPCAGKVYNIAGGRQHTLLDLLACLQELIGVQVRPEHREPRMGDIRHSWADVEAAARDLEYAPTTRLRDGLARTIGWFSAETRGPGDTTASVATGEELG